METRRAESHPARRVHTPQGAVVRVRDHEHAVAPPDDVVWVPEQRGRRRAAVARLEA